MNDKKQAIEKKAPRYVMYGFGPKKGRLPSCLFICLFVGAGLKGVSKVQPASKQNKQIASLNGLVLVCTVGGDKMGGRKGKRRETQTVSLFVFVMRLIRVFFLLVLFMLFVCWYLVGWMMDGLSGHSLSLLPSSLSLSVRLSEGRFFSAIEISYLGRTSKRALIPSLPSSLSPFCLFTFAPWVGIEDCKLKSSALTPFSLSHILSLSGLAI